MRRRLDGVLLLDKPAGLSSNAALQIVRRRMGAAKAGHGGTLDPLATGLLPVLFGEATKFSGLMLEAAKTYRTRIALGVRTDTGDAEGRVIATRSVNVDADSLQRVLASFRGEIEQVPPMHSALKQDGKPLYLLAREGREVPRKPRRVTIESLQLCGRSGDELDLEVSCSKGTYIRTLAEDIGERLGCGAHVVALRRTATGGFDVRDAWSLDALQALPDADLERCLLPVDCLVRGMHSLTLGEAAARRFRQGQRVPCSAIAAGAHRIYGSDGAFLGIGEPVEAGLIQPLRVIAESAQAADNH